MEPLVARLASSSLKVDTILLEKSIKDTSRAKTMLDVTRLDVEFHEIILEASGNGRLLKLWRSLRGELELWLGRLHRRHEVQKLNTRTETIRSHQTIVDCFKLQTPTACESLMRKHIIGWREWLPTTEVEAWRGGLPSRLRFRLLLGRMQGVGSLSPRCVLVLLEHCYECHNEEKTKSWLALDKKQGWEKDGESGTAIVPRTCRRSTRQTETRYLRATPRRREAPTFWSSS